MLNLNKAMIIGNATRDAELRTTPNGKSVASFAVATNRRYTDASGEKREEVQFHEVVAWGKLGEIAQMIVKKGSKVYVEGRIQTRNWEGQDGAKRERTEIIADNIIGLSGKGEGGSDWEPSQEKPSSASNQDSAPKKTADTPPVASKPVEDEINLDDIPF
jgi:single-strand DNA-binding protein